jgi:hypothetical protein
MVSSLVRYTSFVRDAVVTAVSLVIVADVWVQYGLTPGADLIYTMGVSFVSLSVMDATLMARRREARRFYLWNAIYQLFPSFFIALFVFVGLVMLALNALVLYTLKKEPPEAQATSTPQSP